MIPWFLANKTYSVDGDADMASTMYFDQECPICGRLLQVRLAYLGRKVACQHCHGEFEACDPDSAVYPPSDSGIATLQRAGQLLGPQDEKRARPR